MIDDGLKRHFLARPDVARLVPEMEAAVAGAKLTVTEAARRLLGLLDEGGDSGRARPPGRGGTSSGGAVETHYFGALRSQRSTNQSSSSLSRGGPMSRQRLPSAARHSRWAAVGKERAA